MTRSEIMARVRARDTAPELAVRRQLRSLGLTGYRLHRKDLPGKPDIAFIGRKKVIFIHGCFWHGHDCKDGLRQPKTSRDYWRPKIEGNRQRDQQHLIKLAEMGWSTLTIWECELRKPDALAAKLAAFVAG